MTCTRMRKATATLAAALLAAATAHAPASAADADGNFAIHGIGAIPCSDLTAGLLGGQAALRDGLAAWITGYVSATNRLRAETYDATPIQQPLALTNMVVNICTTNQQALVETAVSSLIDILSVAALPSEAPQQDVTVGERGVRLRTGTLKHIQQALVDHGLLAGVADGVFGPSTEKALREYQKYASLPETGLPDAATVVTLLVGRGKGEPPAAEN